MYRSTVRGARLHERLEADAMAERDEFEVDENWVLYDVVEPHIARITINRPERRNAILSPDMHELFEERLRRAERDDDVKVVLLVGAGPDFCAGDDVRRLPVERAGLKKGSKLPQTARIANARRLHRHLTNWLEFPKTVIAVCQGDDRRRGPQPGVGRRSRHRRRRSDVRPPAGAHRLRRVQHRDAARAAEARRQPWLRSDDHGTTDLGRGDAASGVSCRRSFPRRTSRPRRCGTRERSRTTRPTG